MSHSAYNARSRFKIEMMSTRRAIMRHQSPRWASVYGFLNSSGSLAMLAAIRRVLSRAPTCLFRFYIIITVSTSHLYAEKITSSLQPDGVAPMRSKCSHMVEALQAQARFCDELASACLDQTHAEDFRRKADKYRAAAVLIPSNE
jgi:hypothetical protein